MFLSIDTDKFCRYVIVCDFMVANFKLVFFTLHFYFIARMSIIVLLI